MTAIIVLLAQKWLSFAFKWDWLHGYCCFLTDPVGKKGKFTGDLVRQLMSWYTEFKWVMFGSVVNRTVRTSEKSPFWIYHLWVDLGGILKKRHVWYNLRRGNRRNTLIIDYLSKVKHLGIERWPSHVSCVTRFFFNKSDYMWVKLTIHYLDLPFFHSFD